MLKFLGRGSAFADEQNSAYFFAGDELVLIDCPMSAFHKLRKMNLSAKRLSVLVTHTHSDHIGGIPMLIHFAKYVMQTKVRVIVPSAELGDDLEYLIGRLDGCAHSSYEIVTADAVQAKWLVRVVPVHHTLSLEGRCFGYVLRIAGNDAAYTGDTSELAPFLPYLHKGAYLYAEAANFDSGVHLQIDAVLPELKRLYAEGVHIYLMHLDDEAAIAEKIAGTGIEFAPLA